jgi:hypothetical protein
VASDFDGLIFTIFKGREAYISALGLHGLHLIKNLTPSQASPVRKRVRALSTCVNANLVMKAHL